MFGENIKRLYRTVICAVMALTIIASPFSTAAAEEPAPTYFPGTVPLVVSSYKTKDAGTNFEVLEIYNSGSVAVDLSDFTIVDVTNSQKLNLESAYTGVIMPGSHVLLTTSDTEVRGSTYHISGWSGGVVVPAAIRTLRIEGKGYRSFETILLASELPVNRVLTTSGYSTATTAAAYGVEYRKMSPAYNDNQQWFDDGLYISPSDAGNLQIAEIYSHSSSCSPFDTSVLCGDYIKIFGEVDDRSEYVLRSDSGSANRTAANTFNLSNATPIAGGYLVHRTDAGGLLSLTNSGGYVWLEDALGMKQYTETAIQYLSAGSSLQGYSYALASDGTWQWTATPQPYGENVITAAVAEPAPCPEGKYRNPDTNRCRNLEEVITDLVPCQEGYERNALTNRCRKIASTGTSLTPCKEGQERNPATNRCRSIASAVAELLPCDEGYERNPATNRCRKVQGGNVLGAEYPVEPYKQEGAALATWWVVGGIAALAAGYGVWEWRREIGALGARILRKK